MLFSCGSIILKWVPADTAAGVLYRVNNSPITFLVALLDSLYAKTYDWTPKTSLNVDRLKSYGTLREKAQIMAAILDFRWFCVL